MKRVWFVLATFLVGSGGLFVYHLLTGVTPSRVALHVELFNFDIYWYGILIVGGIMLGGAAVSELVNQKARLVWREYVPAALLKQPLAVARTGPETKVGLPAEIVKTLAKRRIQTVGELLYAWGLDPRGLGLNKAGQRAVGDYLAAVPGVNPQWLADAPWRVWNPEHVWNGVAWCLVLGVIGARLYHVLTPSPSMAALGIHSPLDYFRQPFQLINLRSGGLGIYGGVAGGAIGLFWYTRRKRLPGLAWADLSVVGLALGQVVGRWGNFFNQELYGRPSDLPWAITIHEDYRLPGYTEFSRFHPAFLYESLWSLLSFFFLLRLARRYPRELRTGDLTALYLILYGLGRILLETVRLDSRTVSLAGVDLGLPVASLVSLILILTMTLWIILRRRRRL
ncbi:MAG: prolipoprotein diacylglyceryl transferase [Chloroflexota bacterium]